MFADLRDKQFKADPRAIYVCGHYGVDYMDQFSGVGPSTTPYKMKAIVVDGVVYIPEPAIGRRADYSHVRMVAARAEIPATARGVVR